MAKNKLKVVLVSDGVRALLKEVGANQCMKLASDALSGLGQGYEVEARTYPERNGAIIRTTTYQAKKDNYKNNTILKALGK